MGQGRLAEAFDLLAEEVEGGEEAFGGGGVQRAAAGFDGVALAVGVEVAEGFAVGEDAGEGADGDGNAGQGGVIALAGSGFSEAPVGARERVGGDARIVVRG